MTIQQKRERMTHLIDNIKEHSDRLSNQPVISTLELSAILAKITRLAEETVILKFLCKQEQINDLAKKESGTIQDQSVTKEEKSQPTAQKRIDSDSQEHGAINSLEEEVLVEEAKKTKDESPLFEEALEEDQKTENKESNLNTSDKSDEPLKTTIQNQTEQEEDVSLKDIEEEESEVGTQDVNEAFHEDDDHSLSEQLKKQAIPDLITAIGLNERYLYANELFGGDIEDFRTAIRILNDFETGKEAINYFENELRRSYGWEEDNSLASALLLLVKRRFQ